MLLSREEMSFDFEGAVLDPVADRDILEWILNQFLYGEMTGIQVGHWLYAAPDVASAKFLAKQSVEEMQHVDNFLRMMSMMDCRPMPAHPMVRFLSTGMMSNDWAEHVCLEMAAGEGFVLMAFYAIIDCLDHKPSVDILKRAVKQEERHVAFGEQQTAKLIQDKPGLRRRLVGLSLVSLWGVSRLAKFMAKRLPSDHPVLSKLPEFLAVTNQCAQTRMIRIGLIEKPLEQYSTWTKTYWVGFAYVTKAIKSIANLATWPLRLLRILPNKKRLTDKYLTDPHIKKFSTPTAEKNILAIR